MNERLNGGEAADLAAQLTVEIGSYLQQPVLQEKLSLHEFYERVALREGVSISSAAHHVAAAFSVLGDAVSSGEMDDVRSRLPREYDRLFEAAQRT